MYIVIVMLILQNIPEMLKLIIYLWDILKTPLKLIFELFDTIQDTKISEIQTFLNKTKYEISEFFMGLLVTIKISIYIWIFTVPTIVDYIIDSFICDWNYKITSFFHSIIVWYEIDFTNFFARYDDQFINKLKEVYKITAPRGTSDIIDERRVNLNNYQILDIFDDYIDDDRVKYKRLQLISCCITLTLFLTLSIILTE